MVSMKVRKAVFPVGGWGTRFLPATKAVPKAMFPIINKPIIHYIVEEAIAAGCEQIIFVTTPSNHAIEDYFSRSPDLESHLQTKNKLALLRQIQEISSMAYFCFTRATLREHFLGLGSAVLSASKLVGEEPFAVLLANDLIDCDPPCLKSLVALYEALHGPAIAAHRVSEETIATYGNIGFCDLDSESQYRLQQWPQISNRAYEVTKLVQKPDPRRCEHLSNMAIVGRYVLPPTIFPILEQIAPGYEGEVQLTDALDVLRQSGQRMYAYEFGGQYYDTRSELGYVMATIGYALKQKDLAVNIQEMLSAPRCG
jgi:UTP--glucose-1-phosphate uridylyltransferase